MEIKITINKITEDTLGSWDGYKISDVADAYSKYVTEKWAEDLKLEFPNADISVEQGCNLGTRAYELTVNADSPVIEHEAEEKIHSLLTYSTVWDDFCRGEITRII